LFVSLFAYTNPGKHIKTGTLLADFLLEVSTSFNVLSYIVSNSVDVRSTDP
jgi:hypothetical protein